MRCKLLQSTAENCFEALPRQEKTAGGLALAGESGRVRELQPGTLRPRHPAHRARRRRCEAKRERGERIWILPAQLSSNVSKFQNVESTNRQISSSCEQVTSSFLIYYFVSFPPSSLKKTNVVAMRTPQATEPSQLLRRLASAAAR